MQSTVFGNLCGSLRLKSSYGRCVFVRFAASGLVSKAFEGKKFVTGDRKWARLLKGNKLEEGDERRVTYLIVTV